MTLEWFKWKMMKKKISEQIWTFLDKKTLAPPRPTLKIKFCWRRHIQNLSEVLKINSVQPGTNFRVFYRLKPTVRTSIVFTIYLLQVILKRIVSKHFGGGVVLFWCHFHLLAYPPIFHLFFYPDFHSKVVFLFIINLYYLHCANKLWTFSSDSDCITWSSWSEWRSMFISAFYQS